MTSEMAIPQTLTRGNVSGLLRADKLSSELHLLYDNMERQKKLEKKKPKRKGKSKGKEKCKTKRDRSPEKLDQEQPVIELPGNASSFAVYCAVRQVVMEYHIKKVSEVCAHLYQGSQADSDSELDEEDKAKDAQLKLPKIVSLGLCGVFELIRQTHLSDPGLCTMALQALLNMLQGQTPEGLKNEPLDVTDALYHLLLDLSGYQSADPEDQTVESHSLPALACSCLLSLVVARGDTGKILSAMATLLISTSNLAAQQVQVPAILTSLQKSIHAVLLGKTCAPDWLSKGIPDTSKIDATAITELAPLIDKTHYTIASDGKYVYIHNVQGLHKVGSGYGQTIRGHVYNSNPDFYNDEPGWLAFASDLLFFKPESETKNRLAVINREKLHVEDLYEIEGDDYGPCVMFSDGENIGHMASSKDESFVVRTFSPICSPMPLVSELPLKLARKCLDVFGLSWFEPEKKIHTINLGIEDIASVMAGKDFAMVRTPTGKILYTGRSQSLGIKQGGPAPGKWAELPIVKSPKIVQYSIGHEGSHALLVAEDGSVFFVGTSKRGEDGDGSLSKARRQPKPLKPKKMIKMEGKNIVFSACNSGTSALVTKEGELYMFGKDKTYTDSSTGLVSDLRDIVITSVALGKAHAVVLSKQGHIYTFGINNKGQCGRDYVAGPAREISTPITMADEEEEPEDDTSCLPGRHRWVTEQCMVCVMCGQCTGYGSSCISNERPRPDRGPGMPCGCGSGDSGCAVCGVCRSCAGEGELDSIVGESANSHPLVAILARNAADVLPPFDLILGHHGDGIGSVSPKVEQRHKLLLHSVNKKDKSKVSVEPGGSDYEQDHVKSTSLPPARVHLGSGDIPVTQIACGQQHTVVLLANGEVYTFGSNQYGQLGQGDVNIRGSPSKVQLKSAVIQVAAGSYHTVLLTAAGQVFTFGSHQKGQLGRPVPDDDKVKEKKGTWFALPGLIPGIGAKHGRRAAWVGASGDQTFLRIDELLINAHTLSKSTIIANSSCIGLIATAESGTSNMNSLMISRLDGSCRNFSEKNQASLTGQALCLDPVYDVLWSYEPVAQVLSCYSVIHSQARHLSTLCEDYCDILRPELAMPTKPNTLITRSHSALFLLACLDTLTTAQEFGLTIQEDEKEKQAATKIYSKDDFSVVNRFESHGGGWGYSGHSIEAIRFMADTDVLLGGFGLFGGRGDYFGKIKVLELGPDGGDNESYGEVLAETEEMSYECGAREKYPMLFPEPVLLHANHWYVAWARISGPSSDCGSSGQSTVTTDDQVVFKFKSSKKSNNGTDVNAGQIPQILYRLPSHDSTTTSRKNDVVERAHILSKEFSRTVTPDCFEALLKLLTWSWHTFCLLTGEVRSLKGSTPSVAQLDLDRLVYISTAALRLIRIYICEVYPGQGATKKTPPETSKIAECVGDHRALLRKILADSRLHLLTGSQRRHDSDKSSNSLVERMTNRILDECHNTFTACFHAFYPTAALKWSCLCELLNILDPGQVHSQGQAAIEGYSRLLSAVMEALCHATIKLTNIMPINCEYGTEQLLRQQFSGEDNTSSSSSVADASQFPLLTCHLTNRLEKDSVTGIVSGHNSFREILDKLLMLIVLPVRQSLNEEKQTFPSALVSSTCSLISALLSELAASATGSEIDLTGTTRPLLTTPTRFTRTSQSAYWNTGNGSPDAVCFSVDRPGIVIAGVCVYGGAGHYDYQVDLLDDQSEHSSDSSHTGRWNTLETVRGSYGPEDCINDIAEIKFDRPVPIKENVKYAISLHNRGSCTLNGDAGLSKVKCPDGTNFTFSPCSLSTNGTNHTRGQIPQILYYSAPQEGENNLQSGKALVEYQARKNAMNITSAIFKAASDLLHRAQGTHMECLAEILGQSTMFTTLLPVCVAYIGPVATMDPRAAVHVLGLVQEIIPAIADLNCQLCPPSVVPSPTAVISNSATDVTEANTTSEHYAVVQSDHPYKPATVSNYKVSFPSQVKWMVLEFDPQCGTAQIEDTLQLYIPAKNIAPTYKWLSNQSEEDNLELSPRWPVYQKFSTKNNWPSMGLVLPGNEVEFSLETASDYVKDDKACFYGFKCTVIGYDWSAKPEEGLALLEKEISYLGGLCASSLMRKDIILPLTTVDEIEEDLDLVEETAQQIFNAHSELLGKGFALAHAPSINQALDGNLPFSWSSNERAFLKDFVNCTVGTSGGRLAAWLQPESYLDPKHCQIQCNKDELQAGWPTVITILTKDQYGQAVHVPNLMMEVKAVPIMNDVSTDDRKAKRLSRCEDENCLTFGGHPPPKLDTSYAVTVKDKKDAYHAICMMKAYENYSFEELRYAAPVLRQPSENMLVRADDDGTYSASWTPSSTGWYKIQVTFDGYEAGEVLKVNVKEPVQGTLPPQRTQSKRAVYQPNKMRRFVAGWSAGLRVRINPSLQSEQIGVIKPNGIISFIDEIHNNDGVWIRLSQESMHQCCNTNSNGYNEAWALQYNQHLGKTLLIPVDEPKSILDEIIKNAIRKELSMERKTRRGGPGHYQVVKCGSSGHNIRCRPNLKATPVGMLVMGNQFTAVEELSNSDGIWVKLDKESMSRYCTEVEGQAWSLACGHDSITYLEHEADLRPVAEDRDVLNIGATSSGELSTKGFDFTSAQQTPSFSAFGTAGQVPSFGSSFGSGTSGEQDQPSSSSSMSGTWQKLPSFGSQSKQPSTSHGTGKVPTFGQSTPTPPDGIPCRIEPRKGVSGVGHSGQNSLCVPPGSTSHKSATSHRNITAPPVPSARVIENYDSIQNLPPELQGISVKDLVKALGESRVNGNGVTPPRTPPGTPKKTLSRSSSPKTGGSSLVGTSRQGTHFTPGSSPHTPPCTPPCTPPMTRRMSAGSSTGYSTPPLTSSVMRNDYRMSSTSPRLGTSSRRSHSVSPQRPDSPFSLVPRLSSMSPIRSHKDNETRSRSPSGRDVCSHSPGGSSESFKGHFSIGVSPPREDIRMSPKNARKDRSKVLRSRRDRGSPPAGGLEPVSAPGTLERPQVEKKVQQAMSPSVAQCTRAVFAAFMWHEGIVHDAMACASFLKFHPGLPKELPNISKPDTTKRASSGKGTPSVSLKHQNKGAILKDLSNINMNEAARKLEWFIGKKMESGCSSATQPEGVVVASGTDGSGEKDGMHEGKHTKQEKPHQSKTREQKDLASIRERYHSTGYIDDGRNSSSIKAPDTDPGKSLDCGSNRYEEEKDSKVPPTLKYIVYFWQEIAMATQNIVTQNLILPSPGLSTLKKSDKKDKDKDKDKKGKKKKKDMSKGLVGAGRGNLFGEAAVFGGPGQAAIGGGIAGDRETKCELCGGMFPHPVTYHMKDAHPGCGRHAKGQGYNSGGNYCPGWAGNCGDGGKGGSTWYLMCEACREKYLREKQQLTKEKAKKSKKKNTPVKQPAVLQILEPHLIMKNNASFLLNLASASGLTIPPACSPVRSQGCILPNVSEIHFDNNSPFPPTPFLYLAQHGAHGADSAFADDLVFSDDGYYTSKPRSKGLSKSSQFDGVTTTATVTDKEQQQQWRLCRSGSVSGDNSHEMLETLDEKSKSAEVSPSEGHPSGTVKPVLLQRSVSEITKRSGDVIDVDSSADQYKENDDDDDDDGTQQSGQVTRNYRMMIGRRRNNSGGMTDGGMSLLKHLSSSMSRLIQTIPKSAAPGSIPVSKTFHRPVMAFVMQRHDLDSLQLGMKQALRKVTCRVFALQAFNWLIRSVSQPTCLHDLFWCFTASLTPPPPEEDEDEENADKKVPEKRESEQDKDTVICEHPLSDITIAGLAVRPLQDTFHTFLQSVSDVMMYLPPGSALQQMAVRCWCLAFQPSDHLFLHKSHVFSNISKILSKSDEGWGIASVHIDDSKILAKVECLADLTSMVDIRSSSRQAMIGSLTDNSTETFWESGDDDRNKAKSFVLTCDKNIKPKMICVHIDNSRDLVNKVTSVSFHGGMSLDELTLLKHFDLEVRHSGWVCCHVKVRNTTVYKLEMKGPDNTLRVRQIKVLGELDGVPLNVGRQHSPLVMQQKACEAETLKVFRLLTSEVFGKLISGDNEGSDNKVLESAPSGSSGASEAEQNDGELDLKEHMVGILFSRSKLTHLQKQVCAHIVQAIRKETIKVQEEWEDQLQTERQISDSTTKSSDTYCFELLSMVLALSGSAVGRFYLARQLSLLQDMLTLMHTSTPRVQRQVLALLRRVLPEVSPQMLAQILGVQSLPPEDISVLCANSDSSTLNSFEIHKQGILDVFLSCIAKAMTVQMKVKGQGGSKSAPVVFKLSDCLPSSNVLPNRWWLRGSSSSQMAEATITLLKDLASGKLSGSWAAVTKSAVAENILSLTKLDEPLRQSAECIKTPTLWLALASLCVLDKEHVARLSSGHWVKGEENIPRPTCDNHDDGETPAIILCNDCGNLCGDCDRFLHLHRRTRSHTRQVFKEEKKAIKVDLHEGCGRTKLFWVMALADSKTLKAVVEFREGDKGKFNDGPNNTGPTGTCRFCGTSANTGLLAIGNVCSQPECQEFARMSCSKTLPCGHQCGGIANEDRCLPCLYGCMSHNQERLKQDSDDMCMICFTDALSAAPAIQLTCGHVFHLHCCRNVLERRWVGPRITFGFSACPICKASIDHPVLKSLLDPIRHLYEDVRRKALMRLEYEGLDKSEAITTPGTRFHNDPAGYAMERYAYYVCYKCHKAYYGGEARCEEQAAAVDHYNPAELVCGACSDVSRAQMCPKHGTDFLEYKCRYCCSVAVFFCFGTTHFCNACHDDFQRVTNIPKTELPHCPAGPKARQLDGDECPLHIQHPPTGEEFALGCGVCRNAHTF